MSAIVDCPACDFGDHSRHNAEWGVIPGVLGGAVCCCRGDCAERYKASQARFAALFTLPSGVLEDA